MLTYFDNLATEEQRRAYTAIKEALEQKSAYAFARCDDGYDVVYEAVVTDNPLLCLAHPWMQCIYDGRSFVLEYINVDEEKFFSQLEKLLNKIRDKQSKSSDTSSYALYKVIFDVLSERIKYDAESQQAFDRIRSANKSDSAIQTDISQFLRKHGKSFSPYGALVEKKAVCNGIAKLFKIVCDRLGLPCACVQARCIVNYREPISEIADTTPCDHLLNVIEIDGQQAFVDLTNGLVTEELPISVYDFFVVNYNVLKKSFLLRPRDLSIFNCNGTDNLYFSKNKLIFSTLTKLRRFAINYISKFKNGEIRMYYNGKKADDEELKDMVEDIVWAHCPPIKAPSGISVRNGFINCVIVDR